MLVLVYLVTIIAVVYYGFGERFTKPPSLRRIPGVAHEFTGHKDNYLVGNRVFIDSKDFEFICDFRTRTPQGILFLIPGREQHWRYIALYFSVGKLYLSWVLTDYSSERYLLAPGLTDGQVHRLGIAMSPKTPDKLVMVLNGATKVISVAVDREQILGSRMYVGGAPWNLNLDVLKEAGPFTGIIANVLVKTKGKLIANMRTFMSGGR